MIEEDEEFEKYFSNTQLSNVRQTVSILQ